VYAHTSRNLERIKAKVTVIPNGVDTHRFNPKVSGGDITANLGLERCKVVLFVGALTKWHRYKGLDILLRAFSLIDDSRFRLLVVGDGILALEYRQLASALFITDRVIFAGDVPDSELPKYYACSDILVLPSKDRSEGFGLTLLEANASGKPVIGTSVGGILSVIQDGFNGALVPPNDPETLACKLKELLCGPDRRLIEMGMNGRMFAENLDWSVVAERTEKLYASVLSS
jgi:glycosyltransferase involved in cell wall biosynthesis